jgi:uncharacterized membrane protein
VIPLLAAAWASLLVAAPALPIPLAAFLYVFASVICHQIPARSFHLDGAQLPVCARCLGIYLGAAAGAAIASVLRARPARRKALPYLLAAAPTAITIALEALDAWDPTNVVRATAGFPLGAAVAFVVTGAATLHYDSCAPPRPIASTPRMSL